MILIVGLKYELTLLGPQSRFGDKTLGIRLKCTQNRTAVLEGLTGFLGNDDY